jgi:hypothetical protein
MSQEEKESQSTVETVTKSDANSQNVLFGAISYADDNAYEEFISNMNISQAIFVLIASANFAQAKGSFNLLESESLSTAVRTIRKTGEKNDAPSEK